MSGLTTYPVGCSELEHISLSIMLQAITYNKQLREQIDNLRRERMMFEAINATLERELARIKRDIADVITAANEAHIAKEKALAEVQALKLHAEKEHAQFEEEWKQLTHIIEDDRYPIHTSNAVRHPGVVSG